MSASKKPFAALIGALAVLIAGLFFATASASAYPAGVSPTLTVSDTSPTCGESVTFSGSNYQPGESVVVTSGSESVTVSADSNGDISGSIQITCSNGVLPETITATGQASGGIDSLTLSSGGGSGSGSGGLSTTGVAVVGIGALGMVLLVGGGLLLLVGKRRKVSA